MNCFIFWQIPVAMQREEEESCEPVERTWTNIQNFKAWKPTIDQQLNVVQKRRGLFLMWNVEWGRQDN